MEAIDVSLGLILPAVLSEPSRNVALEGVLQKEHLAT
jgi:hypothetical protein